jgi:undecaprenyl-diphosphatase
MYFGIGLAQCLAMIPGVSRSAATIVAAMLLGADRRAAAEVSFWLAMPNMSGALAYDLYKSHGQMSPNAAMLIAIGFAVSFVAAWLVIKTFLDYVSSRGFALFAWWRVIAGSLGLIALAGALTAASKSMIPKSCRLFRQDQATEPLFVTAGIDRFSGQLWR